MRVQSVDQGKHLELLSQEGSQCSQLFSARGLGVRDGGRNEMENREKMRDLGSKKRNEERTIATKEGWIVNSRRIQIKTLLVFSRA
jgi:hypothetical protein